MAKVFVSYAQKDRDVALPMIEAMRRANLSVWPPGKVTSDKDWGRQIRRALKSAKCMVYVWSKAAAQSKWVRQEIKTAIQAWASDRLVLATLDDTPLPVGLSDLSSISIRDVSGTKHLIERVQAMLSVQAKAASDRALRAERAPTKTRVWRWFVLAGIIGAVLLFLAFLARNWLKSRSQATNSPLPLPSPPPPPPEIYSSEAVLVFLIVILGAAIGAVAIWLWLRRPSPAAQASAPAPAAGITVTANDGLHVFVSYSRKDEQTVDQLVQQIQQLGYAVWIDRQSASAQRYAAPIVRAIRTSRLVALMCSQNAFASDHVTREVYLAGDWKKPFIVFQLDPTEVPDELLYFVSGFPRVPVANIDQRQLRLQIAKLIAA